jgi:hypothetical protein
VDDTLAQNKATQGTQFQCSVLITCKKLRALFGLCAHASDV